ncbi:small Multidrug Resistance family protein [Acinetobacter sp. 1294596]|jgi:small multidrug resistance pump|uniref:DMT family transporter n=1 Tax=Acinetobacter TaxID=469 RepID=UPI000277C22F|nr:MULTISPECIES: SMR family transporter [Acinetobacter]EJO35360.1 multidrug transporter EmrE [Acinetobacter radioresistens WC-A-157]EXE14431.1 small Multidrug Resistance family protein [Acinetobacter sp. 983759]EXF57690.1 small Multidrug Resistance family protein [Acinetobacter sp. 1294596]
MDPVFLSYLLLAIAIISEVIGTTFLVKSEGFTKLGPTFAVALFYILSFYLLSQVTKVIPIGIAYAIWGGVGIVLTAFIGIFFFKQSLDSAAIIGISMIIGGVLVINLFSSSVGH